MYLSSACTPVTPAGTSAPALVDIDDLEDEIDSDDDDCASLHEDFPHWSDSEEEDEERNTDLMISFASFF